MDEKLTRVREAMLKSTFKDMDLSPEVKGEIMRSVSSLSNHQQSFFRTPKLLKPLMSFIVFLVFVGGMSFYIFEESNHQQKNQPAFKSGSQLNDSFLEVETTLGNERRIYKPVPISTARKAVLFNYDLPAKLPFSESAPKATITEWFGDKNKISLDVKYVPVSSIGGSKYIDLNISNFPNVVSSIIKTNQYDKEISLNHHRKAYVTKNTNVVMLSWIENNIEYDLRYYSFNNEDVYKELINTAQSMD